MRGQVKSLPPWGKALLGCGVGCLGLVVIGVVLFSIGAYYMVSPGAQIATDTIVGPESQAVFRLYGGRQDSQLGSLLVMMVNEIQRADRQNMPEGLQWLSGLGNQSQAKELERWVELEATVTMEEGELGLEPVAAVNLPLYARLARWAITWTGTATPYAGYTYYRYPDRNNPLRERNEPVFAFADNTLIVAGDRRSMEAVLNRLASDGPVELPPTLEEPLSRLHDQWDFYGVAESGVLRGDFFDNPELDSSYRQLEVGLAADGEDSVSGRLTLHFSDQETALRAEPMVEEYFRARQDELRLEGLTTTCTVRRLGTQVATNFSLLGLRLYLRQAFEEERNRRDRFIAAGTHTASGEDNDSQPWPWKSASGHSVEFESLQEFEDFLRSAKVVDYQQLLEGINHSQKVLLEMDGLRLHAIFRSASAVKTRTYRSGRRVELRDDFIFECAAFEMARLLGLDHVPPTVERTLMGRPGTLQAWVPEARSEGQIRPAQNLRDDPRIRRQYRRMWIFDNLIYNDDRNPTNILFDTDGKLWMIDHTQAFRKYPELPYPTLAGQCERTLFERLRALPDGRIREALSPYLEAPQIDALLQRRQLLVDHLLDLADEHGFDEVILPD